MSLKPSQLPSTSCFVSELDRDTIGSNLYMATHSVSVLGLAFK